MMFVLVCPSFVSNKGKRPEFQIYLANEVTVFKILLKTHFCQLPFEYSECLQFLHVMISVLKCIFAVFSINCS